MGVRFIANAHQPGMHSAVPSPEPLQEQLTSCKKTTFLSSASGLVFSTSSQCLVLTHGFTDRAMHLGIGDEWDFLSVGSSEHHFV